MGNPSLFDRAQNDNFQRLLDVLGSPETNAIKKRVIAAIIDEQPPFALERGMTRTARVSVRVVLRQLKASGYHSGHFKRGSKLSIAQSLKLMMTRPQSCTATRT
jgi:hypothetical protein